MTLDPPPVLASHQDWIFSGQFSVNITVSDAKLVIFQLCNAACGCKLKAKVTTLFVLSHC